VQPAIIEREVPAGGTVQVPFQVETSGSITGGVHMVALDVAMDGERYGPLFDFVIGIDAGE
jgi:hypothetical protein